MEIEDINHNYHGHPQWKGTTEESMYYKDPVVEFMNLSTDQNT